MPKLERLMKLLAVLLDTSFPLSAEDLRRRIGGYPDHDASFRRSFERDKDDLRSLGVDILVGSVPETEPPIDGYRVDRDAYAGQDPQLEPDELAALHLAAALVRAETLGDDAFWKLGGARNDESPSAIASVPDSAAAGAFHTAIAKSNPARFTYGGVDRVLEPSRISFVHGNWYVSGHDRSRDAERVFRIDRIESDVELDGTQTYERRPARGPEVIRIWELGEADPIDAVVRIDASAAMWARVHLRSDEVTENGDGSIDVHLVVRNPEAFSDWVLTFLDAAVIVSPEELINRFVAGLDEVIEAGS